MRDPELLQLMRTSTMCEKQEDQSGIYKSQKQIATDLNASWISVGRLLERLGFKTLQEETGLFNKKEEPGVKQVKQFFLTDQKDFTYEIAQNHQNHSVYRKKNISSQRLNHQCSHFSL